MSDIQAGLRPAWMNGLRRAAQTMVWQEDYTPPQMAWTPLPFVPRYIDCLMGLIFGGHAGSAGNLPAEPAEAVVRSFS